MTDEPQGRHHDAGGQGRMSRNVARTLMVLAVVVILVVIFGYMLLVSQGGDS